MLMESLEKFKADEENLKGKLKMMASGEIETMNSDDLETIQAMFKIMDSAMLLLEDQTRTINSMNEKLDKILEGRA